MLDFHNLARVFVTWGMAFFINRKPTFKEKKKTIDTKSGVRRVIDPSKKTTGFYQPQTPTLWYERVIGAE